MLLETECWRAELSLRSLRERFFGLLVLHPSKQDQPRRIRRKAHARSCRSKTPAVGEAKHSAVRAYLTQIGITWPEFQRAHARRGAGWKYLAKACESWTFCFDADYCKPLNLWNLSFAHTIVSKEGSFCICICPRCICFLQGSSDQEVECLPRRWLCQIAVEASCQWGS